MECGGAFFFCRVGIFVLVWWEEEACCHVHFGGEGWGGVFSERIGGETKEGEESVLGCVCMWRCVGKKRLGVL